MVRKRSRVQASSTALERKRSQCVATSFFVAVRRGANVWVLSLPHSLWSRSQTHGRGISICPRVYIFRFRRVDSGELRSDGICMVIIIKGHSGLLPNIPPVSEDPAAAPNGHFIRSVVGLSSCHGAHLTRTPLRISPVFSVCGSP